LFYIKFQTACSVALGVVSADQWVGINHSPPGHLPLGHSSWLTLLEIANPIPNPNPKLTLLTVLARLCAIAKKLFCVYPSVRLSVTLVIHA